ncbi:DarT ssDNA thymidine ADP-ribosyltransferase family protein [Paracoccus versutus]
MGISAARHRRHVAEWTARFSNYKQKWPKHLFRHEPVESALSILRTGVLMSRSAACALGPLANDIAPADIIQNRDDAHSCVRLYFRPRTPTQFHIEGIRKSADFYKGKHAGFLVMLAFDAEAVLTLPGTKFSTGNMQSPYSSVLDGDVGFDSLDFSGIYHDEAYPSADEKRKRCAEVLVGNPLEIASNLSAIIVRTDADMATMKYLLTREGLGHYIPLIKKSDGTGVFFHNFTAVQYVDSAPGRISFQLRWTKDGADIQTELNVSDSAGRAINLFTGPLKPLTAYYTHHGLVAANYRVNFKLEGFFAHESVLALTPT